MLSTDFKCYATWSGTMPEPEGFSDYYDDVEEEFLKLGGKERDLPRRFFRRYARQAFDLDVTARRAGRDLFFSVYSPDDDF